MTELQSPQRRSFTAKTIFGLLLAVVMVAAFATAGSAENTGNPRSGGFHVTKECSQNSRPTRWVLHDHRVEPERDPPRHEGHLHRRAGPVGMADFGLNTDLFLDGPGNNDAYGHVVLKSFLPGQYPARSRSHGGTGRFSGFHASAVVTCTPTEPWHWDGTYWFTPPGHDK